MKSKTILLLLFIVLTSFQCERLNFDGETKEIISGQILDKNNLPLANVSVRLFHEGGYSVENNTTNTKTKPDGSFYIIHPKVLNADRATLFINENKENGLQLKRINAYPNFKYVNFERKFNAIKLFPEADMVNVQLIFDTSSSGKTVTNIRITENDASNAITIFELEQQDFYNYFFEGNTLKNSSCSVTYDVYTNLNLNPTTLTHNFTTTDLDYEETIIVN